MDAADKYLVRPAGADGSGQGEGMSGWSSLARARGWWGCATRPKISAQRGPYLDCPRSRQPRARR
eukprot:9494036-Pyramimonas_sp.AAC.1